MNEVEMIKRFFGVTEQQAKAIVIAGFDIEVESTIGGSLELRQQQPQARIIMKRGSPSLTGTRHETSIDVTMQILNLIRNL